jgi:hypothetical protein
MYCNLKSHKGYNITNIILKGIGYMKNQKHTGLFIKLIQKLYQGFLDKKVQYCNS